jgi:hypothetical protein
MVLQNLWEATAGVLARLAESGPQRWALALAAEAAWLALVLWLRRAL